MHGQRQNARGAPELGSGAPRMIPRTWGLGIAVRGTLVRASADHGQLLMWMSAAPSVKRSGSGCAKL